MDNLFGSDDESEVSSGVPDNKQISHAQSSIDELFESKDESDEGLLPSQPEKDVFDGIEPTQGSSLSSITKEHVDLALPQAPVLKDDSKSYLLRLPHFVKFETKQFDPATFTVTNEEADVENATTIRYRKAADAPNRFESNCKMLQWSDGSVQFVIGDSVFDANINSSNNSFAYVVQKDVSNVGTSSSLECIAQVPQRISLQQSGSRSKVHAALAQNIAMKYSRKRSIELQDHELITVNPEHFQLMQAKEEEKKLRQEKHKADRSVFTGYRKPSLSAAFLDNDNDYDSNNLSEVKKSRQTYNRREYSQYDDEDDEDNLGGFIVDDDGEDEEDIEEQSDDDLNQEDDNSEAEDAPDNILDSKKGFKRKVIDSDDDE